MTGPLKSLIDSYRTADRLFLEACAQVEAAPDNSDLERELDEIARKACRAITPCMLAMLAFPAIEPDDVRAKARWIVKEFDDYTGITEEQFAALMAGWRATAET